MRIMGLDYGEARTVVAMSDLLGITAQGVESIEHGENEKAEAAKVYCQGFQARFLLSWRSVKS